MHGLAGHRIDAVAPQVVAAKSGACTCSDLQRSKVTEKLSLLTPDQLVRQLHVHYTGSEGIVPALQTNLALARRFGDEFIHVPARDFQRDLMLDLMSDSALSATFQEEIISSAQELAKKYKTDHRHAEHVAMFAQQIFRELRGGKTEDGKTQIKSPSSTLSTAEAISVINSGMALAGHFGDGVLRPADMASGLIGAVVKDPVQDAVVWKGFLETVVQERADWKDLHRAFRDPV